MSLWTSIRDTVETVAPAVIGGMIAGPVGAAIGGGLSGAVNSNGDLGATALGAVGGYGMGSLAGSLGYGAGTGGMTDWSNILGGVGSYGGGGSSTMFALPDGTEINLATQEGQNAALAAGIDPSIIQGGSGIPGPSTATGGSSLWNSLSNILGGGTGGTGGTEGTGGNANLLKTLMGGTGSGGSSSMIPGLLGALLGATQNTPAPITQSIDPWGPAKDSLIAALTQAQGAANTPLNLPNLPTTPQIAAPTPYTPGTLATPGALSPTLTDQYIQGAIRGATQPLEDQFREIVMPSIRGSSIANGTPGSSRQSLSEALAARELARTSGSLSSQMMQNLAYQQASEKANVYGLNANTGLNYFNANNTAQQNAWTGNTNADLNYFNSNANNIWNAYNAGTTKATTEAQFPLQQAGAFSNIASQIAGTGRSSTTQLPTTPWWQTALGGGVAADAAYKKIMGMGVQ